MQYNQGYIAGIYEVDKTSGGSVTRTVTYYPAGAMRINGTLYYMVSTSSTRRLKDHLGSASVVTDASGTTVGEDRFYPYGETRFTTGTMYTDKLYTGQREMTGLGIYHYEARFYSQKLGRFLSPDSLVPDQFNPQYLNRFSYVRNNPIRYTDPTGHMDAPDDGGGCYQCRRPRQPLPPEPPKEPVPPDEEPDPIIDIPILGGPIISPGTAPDFDKPLCEMLKKEMEPLEKELVSITEQILSLMKQLEKTTDPKQRNALVKQIADLGHKRAVLLAQLKELQELYTMLCPGF